jgi:cytochrome c oxidase cbb3-type subunit III
MKKKHYGILVITVGTMLLAALGFLSAPSVQADNAAEATYKAKCAACHGPDGKGETATGKALKAGSFAAPEVAKMSDDDLATVITKGKNKMPGYEKSLKPEQIKELVAYIRLLAK